VAKQGKTLLKKATVHSAYTFQRNDIDYKPL